MSVSIMSGAFNTNQLNRSENFKVNYVVAVSKFRCLKKKQNKKSSPSIHVNFKLSIVKTTFSGILLKSIADMKQWSTYQLIIVLHTKVGFLKLFDHFSFDTN